VDARTMANLFEVNQDDYAEYGKVEGLKAAQKETHAFNLLDSLDPGHTDAMRNYSDDRVWLEFNADIVVKTITEKQVITLIFCGVSYDEDHNSFYIFMYRINTSKSLPGQYFYLP